MDLKNNKNPNKHEQVCILDTNANWAYILKLKKFSQIK